MATTSQRSRVEWRALRPSAIPCSSAWYSGSMWGQISVWAASRKNVQSRPDSWLAFEMVDAGVVFDLGGEEVAVLEADLGGVPSRWT